MWCADRSIDVAVSHAMFGRLARWQKGRIGGAVRYLDCELSEGYAVHELKVLLGPGSLPEATKAYRSGSGLGAQSTAVPGPQGISPAKGEGTT